MSSNNILATQAKINNALTAAQSFQMAKMNRSLEDVSDSMKQNNIIQTNIMKIQVDIKNIQKSQLSEIVKANKLKEFEIEQNRLRYEQEQAEKEHIRNQRSLAFTLKNSVEEVEYSDSSILEKYFFLKTSHEVFLELETGRFEISEMEYCRNALISISESKNKFKALLTKKDKDDLNMIKNIELEDENQYLALLKLELKKLENFKYQIQEIKKIDTKSINFLANQKILDNLIKQIKKDNAV